MNRKLSVIFSAGFTGAFVILSLLANIFAQVYFLNALSTVLCPLLLIAALVGGYFIFKDKVTFANKAIWAVIALVFGLALRHLDTAFCQIFVLKAPLVAILATALSVIGCAGILAALVGIAPEKTLPIGFGLLALAAITRSFYSSFAGAEILLYGALVVMQHKFLADYNGLIRTAAVILALLGLSSLGLVAAVCWIIFAFILVPAGKGCKFPFSFRKLTAVLCAVTAVVCLLTYFTGEPTKEIQATQTQIGDTNENIASTEQNIAALQETLAGYKDDLSAKQSELAKADTALEEATQTHNQLADTLQAAEIALDKICERSYYNSTLCSAGCRPLHTAISEHKNNLEGQDRFVFECQSARDSVQESVDAVNSQIQSTETDITYAKERITQLKKQLATQYGQLSVERLIALVNVLALILGAAALGGIAYNFLAEKCVKITLIACGTLALSALLHLLTYMIRVRAWSAPAFVYLIASPHLWTILAVAFLAVILCKAHRKPVIFRVLAIIAAVLLGAFSLGSGSGVAYALYIATLICTALVLVPPVFTEYNSIAKHLFFTFISGGIWQLIWIYHTTKNLNKVAAAEPRTSAAELALCMFLPFYYSFWLLKTAENVELYGAENGKPCKLDVLCLVFAFICPLISTILIQNKINQIVGKP